MTGRRIAVLGGTFDPFHLGHLAVAEQARLALLADECWIVPAAVPPLRDAARARYEDRLAVCAAALAGRKDLRAVDSERDRGGVSYTFDVMERLAAAHPDAELWTVIGADAVRRLPEWDRAADLVATGRFCIVNRSGAPRIAWAEAVELGLPPERTRLVEIDSPDISATEVRRRVAAGEEVASLVGEAAARVIEERGLYRSSAAPVP